MDIAVTFYEHLEMYTAEFGFALTPIKFGTKQPLLANWPSRPVRADNLTEHFPENEQRNSGVLLGELSRYLADVDQDVHEAVRLAGSFLPSTEFRYGRKSNPNSHWFFRVGGPLQNKSFEDTNGERLLELRFNGCQSVLPPSVHPSGEPYEFDSLGDPADVTAEELLRCTTKLACAVLLLRHYPQQGSRHTFSLGLSGYLWSKGWTKEQTTQLIGSIAQAAGDRERDDRERAVETTWAKLEKGQRVTGRHALKETVGPAVLAKLDKWLPSSGNSANAKGTLKLLRAFELLSIDPEWEGVLGYDEFSHRTVALKPTPWEGGKAGVWDDYCDSNTTLWLQGKGLNLTTATTAEAVQLIAKQNCFHPVRDYLKSLAWDGKPRLDTWLIRYCGVPDTALNRAIAKNVLLSAVARVFEPGCKADHVLLLIGPQGIGKSSLARILAVRPEWYSDHVSPLGSKDSRGDLLGKWIVELSELSALRRAEIETVKAFITAQVDHFRKPYGRRSEDVPRQCIFPATTNDDLPLNDDAGNRRFWPLRVEKIDLEGLKREVDQLYAEAHVRYQNGEKWWLDSALAQSAAAEQEKHREGDPWEPAILVWVKNPQEKIAHGSLNPLSWLGSNRAKVFIPDVLIHALDCPPSRTTQNDSKRVARCLRRAGWERKREGSGPNRGKWYYAAPDSTESADSPPDVPEPEMATKERVQ